MLSNISTIPVQKRTRKVSANWDIAFNKLNPKKQGHISFSETFLNKLQEVCEASNIMLGICTTNDGVFLLALNREYYLQEVEANPDLSHVYFKAANRVTSQQMMYDFVLQYLNRDNTKTNKFSASPVYTNEEGLTFVDQIPTQAIYKITDLV